MAKKDTPEKKKGLLSNWIVRNLLAAVILVVGLLLIAQVSLSVITRHNQTVTVPDFTNMTVGEAHECARDGHVSVKVTDSVFVRRLPAGAEPDFEIVEADSAQATLSSLRKKLSLVALVIGLITMLGAAVGLMNSMLVSVKERTREIGTRRALGAKARAIERQFLSEALLIGLAGSAAGILLGLLLGNLVALALDGGFSVPWGWIATSVLLASLVSLSSGLLPARRAACLDPIEALRSL